MANRWAPNSPKAQAIRTLEDAMGCRVKAEMHIRNVLTRLIQSARTEEEAENINELLEARVALHEQILYLKEFHPDALVEEAT